MKIINLTPHKINLYRDGVLVRAIPSSGVARVNVTSQIIGEVNGFPIRQNAYGEVVGLPNPKAGTIYVVSALVAQAAKDRTDLLIVDDTVRNSEGQIIGCQGFARV